MNKRFLFSIVCLAFVTFAWADDAWRMTTDKGGSYDISDVSFFMAVDNSEKFSIVMKDGSAVDDVESVSFVNSASDVKAVASAANGKLRVQQADRTVIVSGLAANATVEVCGLNGITVLPAMKALGGRAVLDVSSLPTGAYILRVGDTAVKFLKK